MTQLPLTDITNLLVEGENNLHIRGYQSNTDERFSSAMTGGIRITYADGEIEEIVTDESFNQVQLVGFWVMDEPEGFETATTMDKRRGLPSPLYSLPMHPIALRRSFYYIRQFELKEMPVCARLYSTALGAYEPYMIKELGNFAVKYQSQLGEISTEWHFEGDKPVFNYSVPEGVKATVIIPE